MYEQVNGEKCFQNSCIVILCKFMLSERRNKAFKNIYSVFPFI